MAHLDALRGQDAFYDVLPTFVPDLLVIINPEFLQARRLLQHLVDRFAGIVRDEVVTHEESFESGESLHAVEHVVDASASDAVVL